MKSQGKAKKTMIHLWFKDERPRNPVWRNLYQAIVRNRDNKNRNNRILKTSHKTETKISKPCIQSRWKKQCRNRSSWEAHQVTFPNRKGCRLKTISIPINLNLPHPLGSELLQKCMKAGLISRLNLATIKTDLWTLERLMTKKKTTISLDWTILMILKQNHTQNLWSTITRFTIKFHYEIVQLLYSKWTQNYMFEYFPTNLIYEAWNNSSISKNENNML